MSLAAVDYPETIELPTGDEVRIDPSTIDADLLRRMNQSALELAVGTLADDLVDEARIDPDSIDADLLERMNAAALELAADDLASTARLVNERRASNKAAADGYALQVAHLMLAATLTRNGAF